jgi:hypothetical protein
MKGFSFKRKQLHKALWTMVYYIFIVPGGAVLMLLRQDPLQRKPDPARSTYWKKREPHGLSNPMNHPF